MACLVVWQKEGQTFCVWLKARPFAARLSSFSRVATTSARPNFFAERGVTSERTGDPMTTHILDAAYRVYLACEECWTETEWHGRPRQRSSNESPS